MSFKSLFKDKNSKQKEQSTPSIARREIVAYLKYAFEIEYAELNSTGTLEMFIDDVEVNFNKAYQLLIDSGYNVNAYLDEEDKLASYINLELSKVFQEISKKLVTYDYQ